MISKHADCLDFVIEILHLYVNDIWKLFSVCIYQTFVKLLTLKKSFLMRGQNSTFNVAEMIFDVRKRNS
jgi:hypothetical protein